ncbi:HNH endonuclease signature motif containing protein [Williamsia phyllosphaerae]|uniref:HNH endonuclease n=1 Tax=Williamsia phyllosphaerae TaxID=885042 RepID=A0ABQ1V1L5_9NOCA|nr:HNH endonuclease signature motif containing protein [Williamsia phyllosphaerae]GGF34033.1 HNH endonuclease [Williamsia phyllosphaerae]
MFEGWNQVGDAAMGLLPDRVGAPVNDVLGEMRYAAAGLGYLEWVTYRDAAELHTQLVEPEMVTDVRMLDALTRCATRIATQLSISQMSGEGLLHRAIALRDRLPHVLECMRLGLVSPRHIRTIVSRTELIDGQDYAADVDAAIAESLRRRGSWSDNRMRDMVDRIVYRHDPDAVRERRRRALDDRGCWIERGEDGMAEVGASMSAENALLAYKNVCDLADLVCADDGRTKAQRRSDAAFTLQSGANWECLCGNADCGVTIATHSDPEPVPDEGGGFDGPTGGEATFEDPRDDHADVPEPSPTPTRTPTDRRHCNAPTAPNRQQRRAAARSTRLHAYTDPATANGTADHPGFLDGYGVISADHVRDLLTDPGVRMHVLGNRHNADGTVRPQPCTQPADPYRPSTALRTYVRARDQYCMWPGCNRAACDTDLDHTDEYDHDNPERGGQTSPAGLIALCRFHHLIKTFTTWLTDQFVGADGRMRFTVTTPEGLTHDGPAHTGEDVIPGLSDIEFEHPPDEPPPGARDTDTDEPTRRRTRLEDKLARRRTERERNRARREADATERRQAADDDPPPPF